MEMKTSVAKANDSFPSDDDALDEPQLLALLEVAESKMQRQKQTLQIWTFFSFYFECYNERNVAFARFEHSFKIVLELSDELEQKYAIFEVILTGRKKGMFAFVRFQHNFKIVFGTV